MDCRDDPNGIEIMTDQNNSIRIGVIGAGHLGKFHIECIDRIEGFSLVGFYDIDKETVDRISSKYNVKAYDDPESLFGDVDAVCIVTPTATHYDIATKAIESGKHLFIEKS